MEATEQPTDLRETETEAHIDSDDETTLQINEQNDEQQQNEPTGSAPVEEVEGPREQGAVEPDRDEKEHQMKTLLSLSHKIAFMKVFEAAPKMRDIFGALRAFMTNSEVLDDEREEVQALVEKRVQDEKASRKASKEKTVDPSSGAMDLANAIKNVAGIDLTALFPPKPAPVPAQPVVQNIPNQQGSSGAFVKFDEPPPIYAAQMSGPGPNSMPPMIPPVSVPYGVPTIGVPMGHAPVMSTSIGYPGEKPLVTARILADKRRPNHYGKLGMNLSHSKEIPSVPEELLAERNKVIPPVPPELQLDYVPPVPGAEPPRPVRQPKRFTLILAGARPRRLWLRKPEDENKAPKLPKEMDFEDETSVDKINSLLPPGVPPLSAALVKVKKSGASKNELRRKMIDTAREFRKDVDTLRRARREELRGANASKSTFHKNTPLAVKRYHARQLSKETGISVEDAMKEIEEQCQENEGEAEPEEPVYPSLDRDRQRGRDRDRPRDRDRGRPMEKKVDSWDSIDHSRGIPGIDRPPDQRRRPRGGVKERERKRKREEENARGGRGGRGGGRGLGRDDSRSGPPTKYTKGGYSDSQSGYGEYDSTYDQSQSGYEGSAATVYHDYYEGAAEGGGEHQYDQSYNNYEGEYDGNYDYYQSGQEEYTEGDPSASYYGHESQDSYYNAEGGEYSQEYQNAEYYGNEAEYATPFTEIDSQAKPLAKK